MVVYTGLLALVINIVVAVVVNLVARGLQPSASGKPA
jgi:hypothetical protein